MPKIVFYNTYTTKQTFDTQEQMFGIYRLMECNAKRNRPYFFDAPFELFCCPDLKFPVAAGWIFRRSGFGKSETACCVSCRGAYGKRVPGCGGRRAGGGIRRFAVVLHRISRMAAFCPLTWGKRHLLPLGKILAKKEPFSNFFLVFLVTLGIQ